MKNLIQSLFTKRKIVIVRRDPCDLRMEEWKTQPALVKMARTIISSPDFRAMLDVLRTEHFLNYECRLGATIEDRAVMQARGEGYNACLANLMELGELRKIPDTLEPTFEEPEVEVEPQTNK